MQTVHDETFCGPLCQHPSCWQSQRRCERGLPRRQRPQIDDDSDDEGLPTQKVVNLLEDYGEDPRDRFPAKWGGRPMHERASSMVNLTRAHTRERVNHIGFFNTPSWESTKSFPKVRAPNATPASPARLSSMHGKRAGSGATLKKVEVQEVFDLDDLQSDWHETFEAKKYYVWVPNPSRKPPRTPLDPMQSVSIKQMSQGPLALNPKDLTEDMVPEELELQHFNQAMRRERRLNCKTPTGGQPYSYPLTQGGEYNGLYDLLDLPREVLADIVNHIEDRELKSKRHFVEAVIRTLPKLERRHTAISLASSNVLLQRPVQLLAGEQRRLRGTEPFTVKQVYQLDDKVLDRLSTANEPPPTQRLMDSSADASTQVGPPVPTHTPEMQPPLNKKLPLPAIGGEAESKASEELKEAEKILPLEQLEERKKVPSVALGLPTIPSGLRYTRTFTYNQQDFDFTLCPIPSPLQDLDNPSPRAAGGVPTPPPSSAAGSNPSSCATEPATTGRELRTREGGVGEERGADGGAAAAAASAAGVVGAPEVGRHQERQNTQGTLSTEPFERATSPPWNMPTVTQMVIHMPKTPNATPVTRQSTYLTDLDPNMTPLPDVSPSPAFAVTSMGAVGAAGSTTPRQPTLVTQKSLALTPDVSGSLQPIVEGAADGATAPLATIRHQMPRRERPARVGPRSVHFAANVATEMVAGPPPQPPSSPNESEEGGSPPATPWQMTQAQLGNPNYQAYARLEPDSLMVIGKGTKGGLPPTASGGWAGGIGRPAHPPGAIPTGAAPMSASTVSPEPWPQVDEEAFNKSLPRTPSSPPKSSGSKSGLSEREMSYDVTGRTSEAAASGGSGGGKASHLTSKSAGSSASRESTRAAKRMWQENKLESPAPPPPSPEQRDLAEHGAATSAAAAAAAAAAAGLAPGSAKPLTIVAEVEESDSEMTISALPPSNLDSASRLPSPPSQAVDSRPLTRDTSALNGMIAANGEALSREPTCDLSRESTMAGGGGGSRDSGRWARREQQQQQQQVAQAAATSSGGAAATRASLEQFDATDETFKKELEGEYERLAKQL